MPRRSLLVALVAALLGAFPAGAAGETTELVQGVTYTRELRTIDGKPVVLHIVTAPKPGGLYDLRPVLSNGVVTGRETLSQMQRPLAGRATVVGVNGDLFSYSDDSSSGILLRAGELVSRPTSKRSSLAIGEDGILSIGRVGFYGKWSIGDGNRRALAQLNRPLEGKGVALFTPSWGSSTPKRKNAVDVVLTGFPEAVPNADLASQVGDVQTGGGTPIPEGGAVLQAVGPIAGQLAAAALPGTSVTVRLDLKPWWDGAVDAIGGGPALVRDGKVALPTSEQFASSQLQPRTSRTAVGQLADGRVLLLVADGKQSWSAGLDMRGLADELVRLGVVNGIALDSGGSSTLAFDGDVLNAPSAGSERALSNALMVFYYGVYAPRPSAPVLSPNGDGVAEEEQVSFKVVRASTVEARLVGPGGHVFYKEEMQREPGTYPFIVAKDILKEGTWKWVVRAVDEDGRKSAASRTFSVNNTLGFLELSSAQMKVKKKKGGRLGISFELAARAKIAVTVVGKGAEVVRTLRSRWQKPGRIELVWDGRSNNGSVVRAGAYRVSVEARNPLGTVSLDAPVRVRRGK